MEGRLTLGIVVRILMGMGKGILGLQIRDLELRYKIGD